MMNYTCARWIAWGASGLAFAVDTTIVIAAPQVADHPMHGVVRIMALAGFVLGCCFWTVAPATKRSGSTVAFPGPLRLESSPTMPIRAVARVAVNGHSIAAAPAEDNVVDMEDIRILKRLDEKLREDGS